MQLKKGCEECNSEFDLQQHHDRDNHLNRRDSKKSNHTITLCRTCHYEVDFWKNLKLYPKAMLRIYNERMSKLEKKYALIA